MVGNGRYRAPHQPKTQSKISVHSLVHESSLESRVQVLHLPMLRKHAAKFVMQWDKFLPGVLWAYRNTPHDSTHEKPSFLLFWMELRSPTEAALLLAESVEPADLSDYREQLMSSLSSARELAASNIQLNGNTNINMTRSLDLYPLNLEIGS